MTSGIEEKKVPILDGSPGQKRKMTSEEVGDLYRRTGALVLRRCRMILGSVSEAEDVMQEVFLRVLLYGDSLISEKVPLSWLYRTAERCCFDRLRLRKRDCPDELKPRLKTEMIQGEEDRQENQELVMRYFHKLEPKLMQVALLHYVDGLTQERIAQELGWSRRTVGKKLKKLVQRAERLAKRAKGDLR